MSHEELKGDCCPRCNGNKTVIAKVGGIGVEIDCPDCNGTGLVNSPNACTECKGSGTAIANLGGLNIQVDCKHCSGSGLEPV